jgi:DNA helicase-2/ATP-dependent DNA helicase PcrA
MTESNPTGLPAPPHSAGPSLNPQQFCAANHGLGGAPNAIPGPLLIIAGAGSGKTQTLASRVAQLLLQGADPRRILLMTFTRRAAHEMTRRAESIVVSTRDELVAAADSGVGTRAKIARPEPIRWSGTFHAVANRLLRYHAESVGLEPSFTVLDRGDSMDLIDLVRDELGFSKKTSRFPKKSTCLSIYSRVVNAQCDLESALERDFPWCLSWADDLTKLFSGFVERKQRLAVLDYDDLLLYWFYLMEEPSLAEEVASRFDHVLVDEYQDTNALQAAVLKRLKPNGNGVTVVGDDAQSIYGFRAASVRNILDFPSQYEPAAEVVTLEQNYRSSGPILDACNGVIGLAKERFTKDLFSLRAGGEKPRLVTVEDESFQVDYVVKHVLEHREAGIPLQQQAVLMRASHHSDALEVELGRRQIPFVKYGGLKFLEAAHVKDVLCILRFAENPRDAIAGFRVFQLLPGVGPAYARRGLDSVAAGGAGLSGLATFRPTAAARESWTGLHKLLMGLSKPELPWEGQLTQVRKWYEPELPRLHDSPHVRAGDLEQLEQISGSFPSRERFLTELTLDPPSGTGDEAGPPHLDEDFLILSTIHSAKGQEWDAVFVLNAVDGCIPSDMATGKPEQIEEERRLLYVAMTRARDHLHIIHPHRFFIRQQHRHGNQHVYTPRTRFIPDEQLENYSRTSHGPSRSADGARPAGPVKKLDVASRLRASWTSN